MLAALRYPCWHAPLARTSLDGSRALREFIRHMVEPVIVLDTWQHSTVSGNFFDGGGRRMELDAVPPKLYNLAVEAELAKCTKPCNELSDALQHILRESSGACITAADLQEQWADLHHDVADGYGRKTIYASDSLEIMLMSWRVGDGSCIHDHGHTENGAIKFFGPASLQHRIVCADSEGILRTTKIELCMPGETRRVQHHLLHAMSNPHRSEYGLTLHIYATQNSTDGHACPGGVTGAARVLDLVQQMTAHTDGGVFHGLPASNVYRIAPTTHAADFPTRLRDGSDLYSRLMRMTPEARSAAWSLPVPQIMQSLLAGERRHDFWRDVERIVDPATDKTTDSAQWRILCDALREVAKLQAITAGADCAQQERGSAQVDSWKEYARMYDSLIGTPCIDSFMRRYISHFFSDVWLPESGKPVAECSLLSVGCGTGSVERLMIDELQLPQHNLSCFDFSPSMVQIAREVRGLQQAREGDALLLSPEHDGMYDVLYAGLNVYQYLPVGTIDDAVERAAACTKPNGYFVSDFVTTDHMRWYPNLMRSQDGLSASLRSPFLLEENSRMFMCSDIINVTWDTPDSGLKINDSGVHKRWLAPIQRILGAFRKHYSSVRVLDAHSLEILPSHADTCPSTRYVVIARK